MRSGQMMIDSTSDFIIFPSRSSVASPSCMCCRKSASHILTVAYRASAVWSACCRSSSAASCWL